MAATQLVGEIPQRLVLYVDVPDQLSTRKVRQLVATYSSHLTFRLGQVMQEQAHARAAARCSAKDARRAALDAAARRAVEEEAAYVAAQTAARQEDS